MVDYEKLMARGGVSLERLATLCRVVEAGGLAKAAQGDISRLSQYSRQIKDLESFFGVMLLRKTGRVSFPTDKAIEIAAAVRMQFKTLQGFVDDDPSPIPFVIGSSHTLIEWYVGPRLKAIREALGGRSVVLKVLRSREVSEALEDHRLDLGLIRSDAVASGLVKKSLFDLNFSLFVPTGLTHLRDAWSILETTPIALPIGGELRGQMDAYTVSKGMKIAPAFEFTSYSLCADAVRRGECAAILPDLASRSLERQNCVKVPVPPSLRLKRKITAVWHRSADNSTSKEILRVLMS